MYRWNVAIPLLAFAGLMFWMFFVPIPVSFWPSVIGPIVLAIGALMIQRRAMTGRPANGLIADVYSVIFTATIFTNSGEPLNSAVFVWLPYLLFSGFVFLHRPTRDAYIAFTKKFLRMKQ
jgi:hypothetical protein